MSENQKPNIIKPIFGIAKSTVYYAGSLTSFGLMVATSFKLGNHIGNTIVSVREKGELRTDSPTANVLNVLKNLNKVELFVDIGIILGSAFAYCKLAKMSAKNFGQSIYQFKQIFGLVKDDNTHPNTIRVSMTDEEYKLFLAQFGKAVNESIRKEGLPARVGVEDMSKESYEATVAHDDNPMLKDFYKDPLEENKVEKPNEVSAASNKAQKRVKADLDKRAAVLDSVDIEQENSNELL